MGVFCYKYCSLWLSQGYLTCVIWTVYICRCNLRMFFFAAWARRDTWKKKIWSLLLLLQIQTSNPKSLLCTLKVFRLPIFFWIFIFIGAIDSRVNQKWRRFRDFTSETRSKLNLALFGSQLSRRTRRMVARVSRWYGRPGKSSGWVTSPSHCLG